MKVKGATDFKKLTKITKGLSERDMHPVNYVGFLMILIFLDTRKNSIQLNI